MNKHVCILLLVVSLINCCTQGCSYDSSQKDEVTALETVEALELKIEELNTDKEILNKEIIYLETQLSEAESRIEFLEEYVDELEQTLEDNQIEGFEGSHGEYYSTKAQ